MRRTPIAIAAALCSAVVGLVGALAGCGAQSAASSPLAAIPAALPVTLSTAWSAGGASWAVVRTGGASVGGRFWQLLIRPSGSSTWRLVTPPGVADNAGLVVAGASDGTLTVGFVPGQQLTFTPLATTKDDGAHWSQGLLPAGLVAAPSALAALPGGRLLAITASGAEESGPGGAGWRSLVTVRALAATPAGRACGLTRLTAAAASPSGIPLVAGSCSRPGRADVFERSATGWTAHGVTLRGPQARQQVSVVQLARAGAGTNVLLVVGTGRTQAVIQSSLSGRTGTLTPGVPLIMKGRPFTSTFTAADGGSGVVIDGRVQYEAPATGDGGWYNSAPTPLPAQGAVPALASGRESALLTALVPGVGTVTIWNETKPGKWHQIQLIHVPATPASS